MVDHDNLPFPLWSRQADRRGAQRPPCTTLAEMIEVEPQIGVLLQQAKRIRKPQWRHYSEFKRELSRLVGWYARNPRLASDDCYDLMIGALTDALRL